MVQLGDRIFRDALTDALYGVDSARELPFLIHEGFLGYYQAVERLVGPGEARIPRGVFLCLCCSEEIPLVDAVRIAPATANTYVGDFPLRRQIAACTAWPHGWLPEGYWQPVKTDVPALLLSGALDQTTPPEYGETLAATLSHSRHVVLPGRGHNDIDPCVVALIESFVIQGGFESLDASCTQTPKPLQFVTDASQLRATRGPLRTRSSRSSYWTSCRVCAMFVRWGCSAATVVEHVHLQHRVCRLLGAGFVHLFDHLEREDDVADLAALAVPN